MSIDIVEIALDKFTDGFLFEKLACEIMRDEGHNDIKRIGTSKDLGMDAVEDVLYEQRGRYTTIFQFTLQDYVLGKLRNTIEKLREHSIDFDELILVTGTSLSPERQQNVKKVARKEFGVTASCYERGTILNRLSDYSNGIFHRHFPDIQKQLSEMEVSKPVFRDTDNARELAIMRTAIAFGSDPHSARTRNSMLDQMILATIEAGRKGEFSLKDISLALSGSLGIPPFPLSLIEASVRRLSAKIHVVDGKCSLAPEHEVSVDLATIRVNRITESLISDVVEEVCSVAKTVISSNDRHRLERNAKDVLCELFRLNSVSFANAAVPDQVPPFTQVQAIEGLVDLAKRGTTTERGEQLLAVLASVFSNPTPEQVKVLAGWARIYLGVAVMNLDPVLRECQLTKLREKIFILDTDMVLGAIVRENPTYTAHKALVQCLISIGAQVVIPTAVVAECAAHAGRSPRTYLYHKDKLLGLPPEVVTGEVRNLFVRAYHNGITNGLISRKWSYDEFLANYYEPSNPTAFMTDVLRNELPPEVKIIQTEDLLTEQISIEEMKKTTEKMLDIMSRRLSFDSRTQKENTLLASTDASLLLTSMHINTRDLQDYTKRILWARCYIVTNSFRYLSAASELGFKNHVSTTPRNLIGFVENISGPVVSDADIIQLLENPLLVHVVGGIWPDLQKLLAHGISLAGKSLSRLKCDLDGTLHQALVSVDLQDQTEETDQSVEPIEGDFVELISKAESLGYEIDPIAKSARDLLSSKDEKNLRIKELENHLAEYERVIAQFGKKKQRYLRRMGKGVKKV